MCVEGYTCHRETLSGDGDFDPRIKERIEAGRNYTAVDYAEALRTQARLKRASVTRLDGIDALLAPTTLYPAPRIEDVAKAPARLTTRLVNYLGLCAVTVPCGFSESGLPVGLQIIGKPFAEARILSLAHAYECATTHRRRLE